MKMRASECRTCGAAILWTTTAKGKKMPVDLDPVPKGSFILEPIDQMNEDSEPRAVWIGPKDPYSGERYTSHFETCPDAKEHSRRGKPGPREAA